jgi:hypothetical protein
LLLFICHVYSYLTVALLYREHLQFHCCLCGRFSCFQEADWIFMWPARAIAAASLASPVLPQSSDNAMMQAVSSCSQISPCF